MKNKTFLITIVVLLIVIVIIVGFAIFPWASIALEVWLTPNPPKPEIMHGEFPFRLVYEVNGQRKVVQDILICDYCGIGMDEGRGKYRKWKDRLASGNKDILLIKVNNTKEIYYNPGPAEYYMNDMGEEGTYKHNFPDACYSEKGYHNRGSSYGIISADELFNKYHIKLISWDYTQPIKNKFSTTKK